MTCLKNKKKVTQLEELQQNTSFWENVTEATKVEKKLTELKFWIATWDDLQNHFQNYTSFIELLKETKDKELQHEFEQTELELKKNLEQIQFKIMLSEPNDSKSAIVNIHPGAGGTESCDWAQMLMRMYIRYFERHQMSFTVINDEPGEKAGIKTVCFEVNHNYAYGYLKSELGVHRLVRISPFDSGARRHTSFAAVEVYPILEDFEFHLEIKDLRIDTYRASGAGGQHVNKTDSAVRITHIPTGIISTCQSDRSQHKNKANALKILTSKVYQHELEQQEKSLSKKAQKKLKIEWGSQIRSYVFHPYNMVKDLRTQYESSNTKAIMDGDLDAFIQSFLLSHHSKNS